MSESAAARALKCSLRTVNQIVCGRRALTVDMACRLERFLGVESHEARDWLYRQVDLDLWNWHRRQPANRPQRKRRPQPPAPILLLPPIDPLERQAEG